MKMRTHRKIVFVLLFIVFLQEGWAQPSIEWIDDYGIDNTGFSINAEVKSITEDTDGNVYVIAWRDTTWPTTMSDAYPLIIKYNPAGNKVWEHNCKDTVASCRPQSILTDNNGNLYMASSGCWLFKYDVLGNIEWIASINDSCPNANIGGYGNNNIYLLTMSAGLGLLSKYNSIGDLTWQQMDVLRGNIFLDKSENVYLARGSWTDPTNTFYLVKMDSSGMTQWQTTHTWPSTCELSDFIVDSSGNSYLGGWSYGFTDQDYVVIKYDSSGTEQWWRNFNGPGNWVDKAYAMAVDKQGNVYITGEAHLYCCPPPDGDFTTVKYDSSGVFQWVQYYNGTGDSTDQAAAIALDDSGNVYVAGNSWGMGTEQDYAIVKYDPDGNQKWVVRYDGGGQEIANQLIVDKNGNIYVSGNGPTIKYSQGLGTGIEEESSTDAGIQFTIYPNPFTASATIRITNNEQGIKNYEIKIYDLLGREVYHSALRSPNSIISRGNLPSGMYFYKLMDKQKILVAGKVIIQ